MEDPPPAQSPRKDVFGFHDNSTTCTNDRNLTPAVARALSRLETHIDQCFLKQNAIISQKQEELALSTLKHLTGDLMSYGSGKLGGASAAVSSRMMQTPTEMSAWKPGQQNGCNIHPLRQGSLTREFLTSKEPKEQPPNSVFPSPPASVATGILKRGYSDAYSQNDGPAMRTDPSSTSATRKDAKQLYKERQGSRLLPMETVKKQASQYVTKNWGTVSCNRSIVEKMMAASKHDGQQRRSSKVGDSIIFFELPTRWSRTVAEHPFFEWACSLIIVLHSAVIGFMVETDAEQFSPLDVVNHIINCFFVFELALRLHAYRVEFLIGPSMNWNLFDAVLVVQYFAEVAVMVWSEDGESSTTSSIKGLRVVRMLRIVRIIRVFRFCKELGFMAMSIMDSIKSLMWALILLGINMYVFAVSFTQSTTDHFKQQEDRDETSRVLEERFGSVPRAFYTLMQSMTSGLTWGEVCDALMVIDWIMPALFLFYIAFTILALLNIITGVFVDSAVQTTKTKREFMVQKEVELRERYIQEMSEVFSTIDADGSGMISKQEFLEHIETPDIKTYFWALGLNNKDMQRLFTLIDDDGSGEVSINEFLEGCIRLKGEARSIDVHVVLREVRKHGKWLCILHHHLQSLKKSVNVLSAARLVHQIDKHDRGDRGSFSDEGSVVRDADGFGLRKNNSALSSSPGRALLRRPESIEEHEEPASSGSDGAGDTSCTPSSDPPGESWASSKEVAVKRRMDL